MSTVSAPSAHGAEVDSLPPSSSSSSSATRCGSPHASGSHDATRRAWGISGGGVDTYALKQVQNTRVANSVDRIHVATETVIDSKVCMRRTHASRAPTPTSRNHSSRVSVSERYLDATSEI